MPRHAILLSAGEASGDLYAAQLAAALKKRADIEIFGMGGPNMRAAGVDVLVDYSEVSVLGITEILSHLPQLVRAMRKLVSAARERKPSFAVLTDFPGFHLRLARKLKPLGVKNIYYILPQFWAWRPWRVNVVRRRFALGLCIFPFEEDFYRKGGVPVKFIGHPLVGTVKPVHTREEFAAQHGIDSHSTIISLLPGSRWGEISRHLPVMVEAARELTLRRPGSYEFFIPLAPNADLERVRTLLPADFPARLLRGETYDAVAASDAAIVCSGTATVETALLGTPFVVVYRVSAATALLAKPLLRTSHFGMVNLIAGREVAPELIQQNFTPAKISAALDKLLEPANSAQIRANLAEVRAKLGLPGAVDRAADAILELLTSNSG